MKKIITRDGSETLFNTDFNEAYHSTKAGALTESLYKFIYPCKIDRLAEQERTINILDVGFGLGYNVATAIFVSKEKNPNFHLNILSVESDKDILQKIKLVDFPSALKEIYKGLLTGVFSHSLIGDKVYRVYKVKSTHFSLNIVFGDGREVMQDFLKQKYVFDAVFYDAFSPKVNAEMWTLEIFRVVYRLMTQKAILATYSASLSVRKALLRAGFKIGLVQPIGRKSFSTVATKNGDIPPLPEEERVRIENSPYACVMRDKGLKTPRHVIYENWLKEVEIKKALISQRI